VADGMVRQVLNESFGTVRIGGTWNGVTFPPTVVFNGETAEVFDGLVVVRDDAALLRTYAALALRETNRIRASYSIAVPYFSEAYRIGDRVRMVGEDGYDFGTHQVRSVVWNLTRDHGTRLSTDNEVPLVFQDLGVL